jgi:triosephosphate isomerase
VICVGETFSERQIGQKDIVINRQVSSALKGISLHASDRLVIAYEPVWVIGSGQAVEPAEARATARVIMQTLIDVWPERVTRAQVSVIYGGSVDPSNVSSFVGGPLSGVLVGGASLSAKNLLALVTELA